MTDTTTTQAKTTRATACDRCNGFGLVVVCKTVAVCGSCAGSGYHTEEIDWSFV